MWADAGFNPRAHVGRDLCDPGRDHPADAVSIHAPTWGATQREALGGHDGGVSIHAPTWGATTDRTITFDPQEFQSTRPRGARQ